MRKYLLIFLVFTIFLTTGCGKQTQGTLDQDLPNKYTDKSGWSINYPASWKMEDNFLQETSSGKTLEFYSVEISGKELQKWINAEIERKLAAEEANNILLNPLESTQDGKLTIYQYTIQSEMESSKTLLENYLIFDGKRKYEFRYQNPPIIKEEFQKIIDTFRPVP